MSSTILSGQRVSVVATSRQDVNGSKGQTLDFDEAKGRFNVRLDSGQTIALKRENLELLGGGGSSSGLTSQDGLFGYSWASIALGVMALAWAYQFCSQFFGQVYSSQGSLWGGVGENVEYDYYDDAFKTGQVREITTLEHLRGAIAQHADSTGLPVIVDFFSHSCGPCRVIAPVFKRLAAELKGKAVFFKVDANRNYEASSACQVSGLPTIQFYLQRKLLFQVRGADERALRHYAQDAVKRSEEAGVFVDREVTLDVLRQFYKDHDPSKVSEVETLAEKYSKKTALLVRTCQKKYGETPEASLRTAPTQQEKQTDVKPSSMETSTLLPTAQLRTELNRLRAELRKRGEDEEEVEAEESDDDQTSFSPAWEVAGQDVQRVAIVGGGPAALSAALYAARAGLRPVVLAPAFGGQLLGKGVDIENYPGIVGQSATGRGLIMLMRRQAQSSGARFVDAAVVGVNLSERPFRLSLNGTEKPLQADAMILASGAESRWLNVEKEQALRGNGVSACATCDGFAFRDQDVLVVGGGDHAMEDALHLARTCRSVTIVHRRDLFRASKVLSDRVLGHESVKVHWNHTVKAFHEKGGKLSQVTVVSAQGREKQLSVSGAFIAIGHDPQTGFLAGQLELNAAGYVILRSGTTTSVRGVFAAGDVADPLYRQAITASGTGAMAALDAERFLNEEG
eukprot:TRINITY_DN27154_c0_g1_i1.p1 TRINITY_DN27154_c0_g1~~TRINITY_DN27154_c0_g1_i1.p1  ORF type:complete len:682 (+),score=139.56 TRINITY_DN27154_c0_g1_i1:23-2068(+)